jgi:DNA gyrase subunit A
MKGGIIAIKLREDDELVDVVITKTGDEVVLSTAKGMAIRFNESNARSMGRNTSGVKGINLTSGDSLVAMVVADPEATLLTVCQNGYGKRTKFGPNDVSAAIENGNGTTDEAEGDNLDDESTASPVENESPEADTPETEADGEGEDTASGQRYRTQRRGGKGVRDIKTTKRNGPVIGCVSVGDDDEVLVMTARGKLQRLAVNEINVIGRNTQGVRIMSLDEGDTVAVVVRVPKEATEEEPAADGS